MNFLLRMKAVWQKVGLVQRALLIAIVVTFALVGGLLVHWARRPDMRMLYHELAPEEASQITEKISEEGITYELRNGGTSIYVPKEKVYQLRLDLAKDGLPAGEQGGYKIFENEKIGVSPFVQSVNLKRALQEELAKSIQMIEGVAHARVHIVRSEQTLFTSEAGKTTASVVLRLQPGYRLSALNIAAITHLVSGSVEGLTSENVTAIDSQGRLLSGESDQTMAGGAGTVQDYRERVEHNLEDKVEELLTTVLGPGRAKVRIHAVIDMNSVNTITEKYEPKGVPTKEEITTGSETEASSAGGNAASPGTTKKDEIIVTEYQVGKTVTQETVLPGEILALSVAAVVDLTLPDANDAGAGGQTARIMDSNDVEKLIENALGLNLAGGDSLKVVEARFQAPAGLLPEAEDLGGLDYLAIVGQASLGIMAVCALLVLKMFKGAKKKVKAEAESEQAAGMEGSTELLPTGGGGISEPLLLRRQIAHALENDPERVRQLFTSWIEDNGG